MNPKELNGARKISRRDALEYIGKITAGALTLSLPGCRTNSSENSWPTGEEEILAKIPELNFPPNSSLHTTFMPRKQMYEEAKLLQTEGNWQGGDESDWMSRTDIIDRHLGLLADNGIESIRLAVLPFELTSDGETYNWLPLDTAIDLAKQHNLKIDLCVGPLDYPYGPAGIRLPKNLQDLLNREINDTGHKNINISMGIDPNFPISSIAIRDYSLDFLQQQVGRYGHHSNINLLTPDNEFPDAHYIEGVGNDAAMTRSPDYIREVISIILDGSDKKIALNTNIHPSDTAKIINTFGPFYKLMANRGVLRIDTYPTEESAQQAAVYGQSMDQVREAFPRSEIELEEFQASPWPPPGIAGEPWAKIYQEHPEVIKDFYQKQFPPTLQTYLERSNVTKYGLWGADLWPIAARLGYDFPLRLTKTLAVTMDKS